LDISENSIKLAYGDCNNSLKTETKYFVDEKCSYKHENVFGKIAVTSIYVCS